MVQVCGSGAPNRSREGDDNADVRGEVRQLYSPRPGIGCRHIERVGGRDHGWRRFNQASATGRILLIEQHGPVGQTHAHGREGPCGEIGQQASQHVGRLPAAHRLAKSSEVGLKLRECFRDGVRSHVHAVNEDGLVFDNRGMQKF
jgi:hypothetical protein